MRIRAEPEIWLAQPVLQVMLRFESCPSEIGDFVPGYSKCFQPIYGGLVEVDDVPFTWNIRCSIAPSECEDFSSQTAVFVHLQHVDGNVWNLQFLDPIQGSCPTLSCLPRQPRNQIHVDIHDPRIAKDRDLPLHDLCGVLPPCPGQFARNERLNAKAHPIDTRVAPPTRQASSDVSGCCFHRRLGPLPTRDRR